MTARRLFFAANWKLHKTRPEARAFVDAFLPLLDPASAAEVAIAPPSALLDCVGTALAGSPVALAAQNVHPEASGAYTGEVSAGMLTELGCRYVIIGHSERRTLFGETSEFVARKAAALLEHDLRPIVCIGESLAEREADDTERILATQLSESLAEVPPDRAGEIVIAYEPIWAIGTGRTATPEIAQSAHAFIRTQLQERFGAAAGAGIQIQYGGSVKPENSAALMAQPDIDGALVGGAGLEPGSFAEIIRFGAAGVGATEGSS